MFNQTLSTISPWSGSQMFRNIKVPPFRFPNGSDNIAFSLCAALLKRRLRDDEVFLLKEMPITSASMVAGQEAEMIVPYFRAMASVDDGATFPEFEDSVNTVVLLHDEEINQDWIDKVEKGFVEQHPDWIVLGKIKVFLQSTVPATALINKEKRNAIVITSKWDNKIYQSILSTIPALVPGLFAEEPMNEAEKYCLFALNGTSCETFLGKLAALEDYYSFREDRIDRLLIGFENRERENQLNRINREIENQRANISRALEAYENALELLDSMFVRQNGLLFAIDSAENGNEMADYFKMNKSLDIIEASGSRISFVIRTLYENFDPDTYETYRDNVRFIDRMKVSEGSFSNGANIKKFLDAMILREEFKIRLCGAYTIDVFRLHADCYSNYDYPRTCADYIPNYHLDHHHCMGNYARVINDYLDRGDSIGAVNACIESVKSINIAESDATFIPFMKQVFQSGKKCIQFPDGSIKTPKETMKWILEKENAEAEES